MKVLFITRKFPPSKGGMESVAYELYNHLAKIAEVRLIKWGGSNKWLPFILPCFLLRAVWTLSTRRTDVIYLQDGLLAPLGSILKVIFRKRTVITIHGLDITYKNMLYRTVVPRCVNSLDKVICISNATRDACIARGVNPDKISIIPDGIADVFYMDADRDVLRKELSERIKIDLGGKKILLSVGRLVERKGIHWFTENVMPLLKDSGCVYLIAGNGAYAGKVREAIDRAGLKDVVFMLGAVDNETLRYLYNSADVFIMPNIPVEGDMEGFGVVALEAASCGLPVVAADLEGIRDAITDGENGLLVEPIGIDEFRIAIDRLLNDDKFRAEFCANARHTTLEHSHWKIIAELYLDELKKLITV